MLQAPAFGCYIVWPNGTPRMVNMLPRTRECVDENGKYVPHRPVRIFSFVEGELADLYRRAEALHDWRYKFIHVTAEQAKDDLHGYYDCENPTQPGEFWRKARERIRDLLAKKGQVGTRPKRKASTPVPSRRGRKSDVPRGLLGNG